MQRITIETVLNSEPNVIKDVLASIKIKPSLDHEKNIQKLLIMYAKVNLLNIAEKKLVNNSSSCFRTAFYKEMELYINVGKIIDEIGVFKHIKAFLATPVYDFRLEKESIDIYSDGHLLQHLQVARDPITGRPTESFWKMYLYEEDYLYLLVSTIPSYQYETRQYHNEGTAEEPNFVFTGKIFEDHLNDTQLGANPDSITLENGYLVFKYISYDGQDISRDIDYVDPFTLKLIKQI